MAKKVSLSNQCNCKTKSALDKNLNAKANSKNPSETFTVFNQPPDFGKEFIQPGNKANNLNGNAIAEENLETAKSIVKILVKKELHNFFYLMQNQGVNYTENMDNKSFFILK
jgi:hypothetical protein